MDTRDGLDFSDIQNCDLVMFAPRGIVSCGQSTCEVLEKKCEVLGCVTGAVEDSVRLGCDAASFGK
jgi:hypothetical protein